MICPSMFKTVLEVYNYIEYQLDIVYEYARQIMATHLAVLFYPTCCNNLPRMGLVVTVDGSWEIPDSFLVTWYNNEMRRIWDKRDVILQDHD